MGHRIEVNMTMSDAKKVKELGRKFYSDGSLGINQAAHVLLRALVSGEYKLAKVRKAAKKKEPTDKPE